MFKTILMDNKEYLADILSNILDMDKDYILDNLVFKNTEQGVLGVSEKRKITDLIVDIDKLTINLEMNASYSKALVRKNNAYLSRIILSGIRGSEAYDDLDIAVIQINFDKKWKFDDELITTFIKELALMIADNKKDLDNISKGDKVMENVAEKITSLSMDDYIKGYYIKEEQDEWMKKVDINDAMKKGLEKGEIIGINKNKIETAKILLKKRCIIRYYM